jgi:predicted signal transduction protein with EAL and GGDEF domain
MRLADGCSARLHRVGLSDRLRMIAGGLRFKNGAAIRTSGGTEPRLGAEHTDFVRAELQRFRENILAENAGLIARLGGDEFTIVISGSHVVTRAKKLSEETSTAFSKIPLSFGAGEFRVEVSIGVTVFPEHCVTAEELLLNAGLALYRAKAGDGGGAYFLIVGSRRNLTRDCRSKLS